MSQVVPNETHVIAHVDSAAPDPLRPGFSLAQLTVMAIESITGPTVEAEVGTPLSVLVPDEVLASLSPGSAARFSVEIVGPAQLLARSAEPLD